MRKRPRYASTRESLSLQTIVYMVGADDAKGVQALKAGLCSGTLGGHGKGSTMEISHLRPTGDLLAISRMYEESWEFGYRNLPPESYSDEIPVGHWVADLERVDLALIM